MMELIDSRAWNSCLSGGWKDACCSHWGMQVSFRRLHSLVTDAWTGMERLLTSPGSTLSPKNLQRNSRQRGNAVHPPNQGGIQAVIGIKVRMSSEVQECKIYWLLSWSWGERRAELGRGREWPAKPQGLPTPVGRLVGSCQHQGPGPYLLLSAVPEAPGPPQCSGLCFPS